MIISIVAFSVGVIMCSRDRDIKEMVPPAPEGWKREQDIKIFKGKNLYKYIDGSAELYLSYNFNKAVNCIYSSAGQPDIIVDIFDMTTSSDAYGVFSHSRDRVDSAFGRESQYIGGMLSFWKGRYFVSIIATPETEVSREATFSIAKAIERRIEDRGEPPQIISLLPEDNLIRKSIFYFHHYIWLNSYYFISEENILQITKSTDGVLAKYREGSKNLILLILKYRNNRRAIKAYRNFVESYLPELDYRVCIRT